MFSNFKKSVKERLDFLIKNSNVLYQVELDKDAFWDLYLDSFPAGTNEIFRERREYDCSSCRSFIRNYGTIVGIIEGKKVSIWDVSPDEEKYRVVANALNEKIKSLPVSNVFVSKFAKLGTNSNKETLADGSDITWQHFYYELPKNMVNKSNKSVEQIQGEYRDSKNVIKRSFDEINSDAIDTVLDLIEQKLLYRGDEFKSKLVKFKNAQKLYFNLASDEERDNHTWILATTTGRALAIKGTAIGPLLTDLTQNVDIETALRKYESVVAPQNYKRPKAVYSKKMKEDAAKEVEALGLTESLGRRYARLSDITINDVIWASNNAKKVIDNPFDILDKSVSKKKFDFSKLKETNIDTFVNEILPSAKNVELYFDNNLTNSLVSLIAPKDSSAPTLFNWDNPFSWTYTGDFTDSIKESVKKRGGKVDGDCRASLSWAEGDKTDNSDLDLHCKLPNGGRIGFDNQKDYTSGGNLDVDIREPSAYKHKDIVENIVFPNKNKMTIGDYTFYINNYSLRGNQKGFTVEMEFDGTVHTFVYDKGLKHKENVTVAVVNWDGKKFTIKESLPSTSASKEVWGVPTMDFVPVKAITNSPNFWGDNNVGHEHFFFMLEDCINDGDARGFYNEFLKSDLVKHKRVFEALGSLMRVEPDDDQLSGVGFSATKNNTVTLKVDGKIMKINFNTNNDGKKSISNSSEKEISLRK